MEFLWINVLSLESLDNQRFTKICIRSIKQGNYLPIFGAAGPILLFGFRATPI